METIGFYIFYSINWIMTLLPLRILYFFSDILYILLCYVVSYRKKVVIENLRNSFPEKHVKRLEEVIRQNPEYWIWTHRRWKYKKTVSND